VLAVEVLIEATQRLLRAVDDLLDREVRRPPLRDELLRRVQEALHTLLGAQLRRAGGSLDGALAPGGFGRGFGHMGMILPIAKRNPRLPTEDCRARNESLTFTRWKMLFSILVAVPAHATGHAG